MRNVFKLSDAQREKLLEHLGQRCIQPCPSCGRNNWQVDPTVFEIRALGQPVGGQVRIAAVSLVTCTNCGHVKIFNLLAANILTREDLMLSVPQMQPSTIPPAGGTSDE